MKPDIVFFGEGLPDAFHEAMAKDKDKCDLLIVVGSSLKVRPVALIPSSIPADVPQILINREPLPHLSFDCELLGDCDVIVNQLCHL
jgi:NAD+-dependent protein deacetylase sirtuin 1